MYFTNRQQKVKVEIVQRTKHGSQFGSFIHNVLSIDLLYLIADQCDIYNYADDKSICCHGSNIGDVITNLERVSNVVLTWFKQNYIHPNPDKFRFILFLNAVQYSNTSINVGDSIIIGTFRVCETSWYICRPPIKLYNNKNLYLIKCPY